MTLRDRLARKPPGYEFTIGRILATALPKVVSDLGGITQYTWVFTAYMLGSTVTVPLYGKLGDVHGRKPLFIVAIVIFLLGSALCGAAQNMWELVIFRAVQGIGAGGIFPLTLAMIGMIVPPRDRGRYQGLIGSVFAGASIVGPLVGGFIVDNTSWRWIFYVNLPVGGLALAVILVTMPRRPIRQEHSIDWLGAAVLAGGGRRTPRRGHSDRRLRADRTPCRRADYPVRPAAQPDGRLERRVHGAGRCGDVRDDQLRAALRPGRDRHLRDVVGRRSDAADPGRGDDELHLRPDRLPDRPLPTEHVDRPGRPRSGNGPALAHGHPHDKR